MANWDSLGTKGSVEDRRGMTSTAAGGLGIGGIVLLLALNYLSGGSVVDVIPEVLNQVAVAPSQDIDRTQFEGNDSYEEFATTVIGSTNQTWNSLFEQMKSVYKEPNLVLFRGATNSACGGAQSNVGPHYCPRDGNIYLDETFFDLLKTQLGGNDGDVAQAYVIAHEVGHHVQEQLGLTSLSRRAADQNDGSIRLELQADCFAGLWAYSIKDKGVFENGEIQEAIEAAGAVGDDHIQEKTTGRVNPESFTHGTSAQRISWFTKGYTSGNFSSCDTFSQTQL